MNVFYLGFCQDFHLEIIRSNRELMGWIPTYAVVYETEVERFRSMFPTCPVSGQLDVSLARLNPDYAQNFTHQLDNDVLSEFHSVESNFYRMCDRRDFDGYSFNTTERRRHYYRLLDQWLYILKNHRPDLVLFPDTPHTLWDYIAYAVCEQLKIPTLMHTTNTILGLTPIVNKIEFSEIPSDAIYRTELKNQKSDFDLPADLEDFWKSKTSLTEDFKPYYVKALEEKAKLRTTPMWLRLWKKLLTQGLSFFPQLIKTLQYKINAVKNLQFYHAIKGLPFAEITQFSTFTFWKKLSLTKAIKKEGAFRLKELQADYESLATNEVPIDSPFVIFFMHYTPEKTSVPDAGPFADQYLAIDMLSASMPEGWLLLVKEHPYQFSPEMPNFNTRTKYDYLQFLNNKNVRLISTAVDSFYLIKHCKAVSTLTGTVALEGVLQGKPALITGYAWYKNCEGMFNCLTQNATQKALAQIAGGYVPDMYKVRLYFKALGQQWKRSYHMSYYFRAQQKTENITMDENVKRVSYNFMSAYQHYYGLRAQSASS